MNIQQKNSAYHFRMQSEREQTLVKIYAYVNMLGRNDALIERKAIAASLQLCDHNANDSFGTGFHVLKAHVLNHLMTGRCPRKSLLLW